MSERNKNRKDSRDSRHRRIRSKLAGTAEKPRLSVFRSALHIYAQLIDDEAGKTLAASDDLGLDKKEKAAAAKGDDKRKAKVAVAYAVGKTLAEKAVKLGVKKAVFDRGGFSYTGRVAALADGARDNGLQF